MWLKTIEGLYVNNIYGGYVVWVTESRHALVFPNADALGHVQKLTDQKLKAVLAHGTK